MFKACQSHIYKKLRFNKVLGYIFKSTQHYTSILSAVNVNWSFFKGYIFLLNHLHILQGNSGTTVFFTTIFC